MKEYKYKKVYNLLKDNILRDKYDSQTALPTETELADSFDVSIITIKKAMKMLVEEGLINRSSGRGTYIETSIVKKSYTVGLIIPEFSQTFGFDFVLNIEKCMYNRKHRFIYRRTFYDTDIENEIVKEFIMLGCDVIIAFPNFSDKIGTAMLELYEKKFPLLLVDRYYSKYDIPCVSVNHKQGMIELLENYKRKKHINILYLSWPTRDVTSIHERHEGCKEFINNNPEINVIEYFVQNKYDSDLANKFHHNNSVINTIKKEQVTGIIGIDSTILEYISIELLPVNVEVSCFDKIIGSYKNYTYLDQSYESFSKVIIQTIDYITSDKYYVKRDVNKHIYVDGIMTYVE